MFLILNELSEIRNTWSPRPAATVRYSAVSPGLPGVTPCRWALMELRAVQKNVFGEREFPLQPLNRTSFAAFFFLLRYLLWGETLVSSGLESRHVHLGSPPGSLAPLRCSCLAAKGRVPAGAGVGRGATVCVGQLLGEGSGPWASEAWPAPGGVEGHPLRFTGSVERGVQCWEQKYFAITYVFVHPQIET